MVHFNAKRKDYIKILGYYSAEGVHAGESAPCVPNNKKQQRGGGVMLVIRSLRLAALFFPARRCLLFVFLMSISKYCVLSDSEKKPKQKAT